MTMELVDTRPVMALCYPFLHFLRMSTCILNIVIPSHPSRSKDWAKPAQRSLKRPVKKQAATFSPQGYAMLLSTLNQRRESQVNPYIRLYPLCCYWIVAPRQMFVIHNQFHSISASSEWWRIRHWLCTTYCSVAQAQNQWELDRFNSKY